ncbi:MAG: hypothetical protein ACRCVE_11835 [Plesiomonas sp.]
MSSREYGTLTVEEKDKSRFVSEILKQKSSSRVIDKEYLPEKRVPHSGIVLSSSGGDDLFLEDDLFIESEGMPVHGEICDKEEEYPTNIFFKENVFNIKLEYPRFIFSSVTIERVKVVSNINFLNRKSGFLVSIGLFFTKLKMRFKETPEVLLQAKKYERYLADDMLAKKLKDYGVDIYHLMDISPEINMYLTQYVLKKQNVKISLEYDKKTDQQVLNLFIDSGRKILIASHTSYKKNITMLHKKLLTKNQKEGFSLQELAWVIAKYYKLTSKVPYKTFPAKYPLTASFRPLRVAEVVR